MNKRIDEFLSNLIYMDTAQSASSLWSAPATQPANLRRTYVSDSGNLCFTWQGHQFEIPVKNNSDCQLCSWGVPFHNRHYAGLCFMCENRCDHPMQQQRQRHFGICPLDELGLKHDVCLRHSW